MQWKIFHGNVTLPRLRLKDWYCCHFENLSLEEKKIKEIPSHRLTKTQLHNLVLKSSMFGGLKVLNMLYDKVLTWRLIIDCYYQQPLI